MRYLVLILCWASLYMANNLECVDDTTKNIVRYVEFLKTLQSFEKAVNT